LDQFAGLEPDWTGSIAGLPYVEVYGNRTLEPLDQALASRLQSGDVVLADGESAFAKRAERGASPPPIEAAQLIRTWGHWGETEVAEALSKELAPDWRRVWVVRYPAHDPDAALKALSEHASATETIQLADGALELTLFEPPVPRWGDAAPTGSVPTGQTAP
jgi:hypothetical protein